MAGPALRQPDDHHAARRPLAWRGLDLRGVGRAAWRLSLHQSRLDQLRSRGRAALRARGECRRVRADLRFGRGRLGVLSRRQYFVGDLRAVADGRSHQHRVRPRRDGQRHCSLPSMPRSRGLRRTRRRSWVTITRTGWSAKPQRVAAAAGLPLCDRRGAGLRDARNLSSTANSSISGSDERRAQEPASAALRQRGHHRSAAALNFVVDPLQLFRPARFYRRTIRWTAACRMPA